MDLNATARMLGQIGEDWILRRFVGRQKIRFDVKVKIVLAQYEIETLVAGGSVVQGDQKGIISNKEIASRRWPGPPQQGDLLVHDNGTTLAVLAVETIVLGNKTLRHNLQLRGP